MAIAYLNHTPIGKATQAQPNTAAAHIRYIMRKQSTDYVYSERMPVQYHAAQRFLTEREESIRKNGRVCDKFIIALPREMTMEQGVDALRDFGYRLSQGKAPFLFSIQDFNKENPHAHMVFIDAGPDGKRVFRTSDRDSTERIKKVWADTCNEHLLEMGVDAEIKFGPTEEIANDNRDTPDAPECTQSPVEPEEAGDVPMPDEEEPAVEEPYAESGAVEPHERIRAALEAKAEFDLLKSERDELARLEEMVRQAERAALDAHTDFNIASYEQARTTRLLLDPAKERLEKAPRGFHLKLGSWEWKSAGRRERENAQTHLRRAEYIAERAKARTEEENRAAAIKAREAIELDQRREALAFHLRTRGSVEELIEAERILQNTVTVNMKDISLEDVINEFEAGRISAEEARDAHIVMGYEDSWNLYEEMNGVERDEDIEP